MSKSLNIVTYNIHKGFGVGNIKFKLPEIREALEKVGADIVFLQEIQGEHSKYEERIAEWPAESQIVFLAENGWQYFAYGKNALYRGGHHGNAILSKYPLLEWENIVLSKYRRASRSLLHATLEVPFLSEPLHIVCLHFALFKTKRTQQLVTLKERIFSHVPKNAPLIIAGDFNDWRGQAEEFLVRELGVAEVFTSCQGEHAKTFPAWNPQLAVDRIYFRNLALTKCLHLDRAPWKRLSDHVPLYAEFKALLLGQ